MIFDLVICVGPKDESMINLTLPYNLKNIKGYDKVYLISPIDLTLKISQDNIIFIKDNNFPFSISDVISYTKNPERSGWYLQQLLKLYAGFVIPKLKEYYLVIDADTAFLKPTTFFENNLPLFNYGLEYHLPYFEHMKRLDSSLEKQTKVSGICHHMIFNKFLVRRLFDKIENNFDKQPFWKIFLEQLSPKDIAGSGASEYEIYFNFLIKEFPNDLKIRPLKFINTGRFNEKLEVDYLSVHWWLRN